MYGVDTVFIYCVGIEVVKEQESSRETREERLKIGIPRRIIKRRRGTNQGTSGSSIRVHKKWSTVRMRTIRQ